MVWRLSSDGQGSALSLTFSGHPLRVLELVTNHALVVFSIMARG